VNLADLSPVWFIHLAFDPTIQLHLTFPARAVLSPRSAAEDGPDAYSTSIEHLAPVCVFASSVAREPRRTAVVTLVIRTGQWPATRTLLDEDLRT
jgi:hypothetical protein